MLCTHKDLLLEVHSGFVFSNIKSHEVHVLVSTCLTFCCFVYCLRNEEKLG